MSHSFHMSSLSTDPIIQYNDQYQTPICSKCQTGLAEKWFRRHLSDHHRFKKETWGPIIQAFEHKSIPKTYKDFSRPPNGSQPVPYLKIHDGYECNLCGHVQLSEQKMKEVHGKIHRKDPNWTKCFYHPVKAQASPYIF
jgi:hypothetical protein